MCAQYIATDTLRLHMCRSLTVMWGQYIRTSMWGRVITGSGIRGTMLRGEITIAATDGVSIATETTFIAIAGNAKLDNATRGDLKVETN